MNGEILLKRILLIFLIMLLIFSICFSLFFHKDGVRQNVTAVSASQYIPKKIIIDAGHGGFDGGASANDGTMEKDINLAIALYLKDMCKMGGYEVILTRTDESGIEKDENESIAQRKKSDMRRRLQIIEENPDAIFISVHLNKFTTSSAKGTQVFYSANNEDSNKLALSVQSKVRKLLQPENERVIKKADSSIYLLKNAKIPAVIVECGFLSNAQDLALLKDKEYQSKLAFCIYCGLLEYQI